MKRITESEKERILDLHRNTPMKSFLFKELNEQLLPSPSSTGRPTFQSQERADEFRRWVHANFPDVARQNNLDLSSPYYQSKEIENVVKYVDPKTNKKLINLWLSDESKKGQQSKKPSVEPLSQDDLIWRDKIKPMSPTIDYNELTIEERPLGNGKTQEIYINNFTGEKYQMFNGKLIPYADIEPNQATFSARYGKSPGEKDYSPEEMKQILARQEKYNLGFPGMVKSPHKSFDPKNTISWKTMTPDQQHMFLDLAALGTAFIPLVGFFISSGIEAYNTSLYLEQSRNQEASVSLLFSILGSLPYLNRIKILGNFTDDVLGSLAKKMGILGTKKLNSQEMQLMKQIAKSMKTPEGLSNLNQGVINYINRRGIDKTAEGFNKFKNIMAGLGLGGTIAYGLGGAPGNPVYWVIGKSVVELIESRGGNLERYALAFQITKINTKSPSEAEMVINKRELEQMKQAMTDDKATYCGFWDINRPIPLKYQTENYKSKIDLVVEGLETIGVNMEDDCRFPGTFGRPFDLGQNDEYQYKYIYDKHYKRKRGDTEWILVTDQGTKDKINKMAQDKGFVKNERKPIVFVNK